IEYRKEWNKKPYKRVKDFTNEWAGILALFGSVKSKPDQGCYIIKIRNKGFTYYPKKDRIQIHGVKGRKAWESYGLEFLLNFADK
ncbi:hypothetical protein DRO61_07670, partial [Candidatus Bathyarchaeota archaeon]